ncbi:VOC family protein [Nonomuraea fuscirosea]|uniref:VOC family protein n=1 Tax=Nonomuraea fuscirosea TaxID=1291556 RepID=UPI0037163F3C
MRKIIDELTEAHRELLDGERKIVVLRRHYDAEIEDVWQACTDGDRLSRWFLPVSGDLRLGGTYQLEGNAGGEILQCEPPSLLKVSWLFGPDPGFSEVEVRLTGKDGGTELELRHTAEVPPEFWGQFGPGSVGVGWDLALLGLALHLRGGERVDEATFHQTDEGRAYITGACRAWGEAHQAAGAPADEVAAAVARTTAFYAPEEEAAPPAPPLQKVAPFLMFQKGDAEEAMNFYVSLFDDAKVVHADRYGPGEQGKEGSIKLARFTLAGQEHLCSDSFVKHGFEFTPSMSLYVTCGSEEELERLYGALVEGGQALMPLGSYGFSTRFGWVNDRFGVSWQLNLP